MIGDIIFSHFSYTNLLQVLLVLISSVILNFFLKKIIEGFQRRFESKNLIWQSTLFAALYKPLSSFIWFVAFLLSIDLLLRNFSSFRLIYFEEILRAGGVIALAWFLMRWNSFWMNSMMQMSAQGKTSLTPPKLDLISKLATIAIIILSTFLFLDATGHNIQTLIAFGGISGIALAFASQQFISNFFGGLTVYLTQPFSIGDTIQIPDKKIEGKVEQIGWYSTSVRDSEKRPIYIPNSLFNQSIVLNPSRSTYKRLHIKIGIDYRHLNILENILEKIKELLHSTPAIDKKAEMKVFFTHFGKNSLEIDISAYMNKEEDVDEIKQNVLIKLANVIAQEGAEITFATHVIEITYTNTKPE